MTQNLSSVRGIALNVMVVTENVAIRCSDFVSVFLIGVAGRNNELDFIEQSTVVVIPLGFNKSHLISCHTGVIQSYLLGLIHSDIAGSLTL